MGAIRTFRDLRAYREARAQARQIFQITRTFPKEEQYALVDQIRRSSRAVSTIVAEAWGRPQYEAAFADKMSQAIAEALETRAWLDHALDCGYLSQEEHAAHDGACAMVCSILYGVLRQAPSFSGSLRPPKRR